MATRMQQRRGTAAQWLSTNSGNGPILSPGEIGFESDTNKFKIGDGVNHWVNLDYFIDASSTVNPSFGTSIVFEGATADSFETTLAVEDPTADRTLTLPDETGIVATQDYVDTAVSGVTFDGSQAAGTGLDWNALTQQFDIDSTVATETYVNTAVGNIDLSTKQDVVSGVSSTEIGYLDGVTSAIQTQIDDKLSKTGGTMTGAITLSGAPSSDLHAATKLYVDNVTAGINFHQAVHVATTANLSADYNNGTDGVGATLTAAANAAWPTIDGHTSFTQYDRILIKDQTDSKQNGIYILSDLGSVSSKWILTRASDADNNPNGEMKNGDFVLVLNGTVNASYGFVNNSATNPIVIGTDNITYTQFNAGKTVVAGNGLTEATPGTISIDTEITADLSTAQTLTNKTLTSPVISTITNTGTLTLPTTTGTLALTSEIPAAASTATPSTEGIVFATQPSSVATNGATGTGFGRGSLASPTAAGLRNTAIGYQVISSSVSGYDNTGVGYRAAKVISSGIENTALGSQALLSNGSGSRNTAIGHRALEQNGSSSDNTAIGAWALRNSNNGSNTSVGTYAGQYITANGNTAIGYSALGTSASNTAGGNTAVGHSSFSSVTSGGGNAGLGYQVGNAVTTGTNNVFIGYQAGGSTTSGSNNIVIGTNINATSATVSNEITLGNASITSFRIPGLSLTADSSNPIIQATSTQTLTNKTIGATSTTSITANTATTIDTNAMAGFTTVKYVVSIKQGSKIRSSEIIAQTDGTSVDYTEFGITETGGTMTGILVAATTSSTNAVLQVTITDAASTNATVKIQKVLI